MTLVPTQACVLCGNSVEFHTGIVVRVGSRELRACENCKNKGRDVLARAARAYMRKKLPAVFKTIQTAMRVAGRSQS